MPNKTLIDFNDLDAGTIVDGQYTAQGVTITSLNASNPAMIFDATQDPSGSVSGGDSDLLNSEAGGILIASEDGDSSDPDDNAGGACFRFDFESTSTVNSITMVDIERGATIKVFDADGNLLEELCPITKDGEYKDVAIETEGAAYMTVVINGSGAVDNLSFTSSGTGPDGVVNGTDEGELIDLAYVDSAGDQIDNDDALGVEGTVGDADLVLAGDGNDTVYAGAANDIVRGEGGDDELFGEDGDDTIEGGAGNDTIIGGPGDDSLDGGSGNDVIGGGSANDTASGGADDDRLVMGAGDDEADGGEGNDTILGEDGNDTLLGGAGDDSVDGGADDDLIYGDTAGTGGGEPISGPRESFNWSEIAGFGGGVATGGANQNTGTVDVTFTATDSDGRVTNTYDTEDTYVGGIDSGSETINDNSAFNSDLRDNGDNASYEFAFSAPVMGVSFNIADIDGDGVVTVLAFDADGNATEVVLDGGDDVTVTGNVADSDGGYEPDASENHAITVSIAGPVSKIEILHEQDANGASGINVTDVFFDPIIGYTEADGGNDILLGGEGVDTVFGEGGDDTIDGGEGSDELSGGDDQDTFVNVTPGDVIDGNEGGVDYDTLDLTGVSAEVDYDPDNAENGTIYFLDGDGARTGETAEFVNIENVLGASNKAPVAKDDTVKVDEDDSVTITPLANDSDPDGGTLTITSFEQPSNGTLTDNGDGTFEYEPNDDYNGPDSFTYTVSDGQGGSTTATVNITVNPVNDDPVAVTDTVSVDEDGSVILDLADNDTDVDGDTLTVIEYTQPDNGVVTENADGTLTYTPNDDYNGPDSFEYTVSDGNGGTDTGTVNITVDPTSDPDGVVDGEETGEEMIVGYNDDNDPTDGGGDMITDGDDSIEGNGGDDTIEAGGGDDSVSGGEGDDEIDGQDGDDSITGDDGDDSLTGSDGSDTIEGGDGDDTIVSGDTGRPDLGYPGLFPADDDPDNDRDSVDGGDGNDSIRTGDDRDTITGGAGDDTIDAGLDNDDVDGGTGDDFIVGGEGSDTILAGEGNDTVYAGLDPRFPDALNIVDEPGANNGDLVENNGLDYVDGGDGDDLIFGQDDDDTLLGGAGNDTLDGGIDEDSLSGGSGDDSLLGGQGDDLLEGNGGDDTLEGGDGDDSLSGAANDDVLLGGAGNDTITGDGGNDYIDGGDGDDEIRSGNGEDTVLGGTGNDSISGGREADTLSGGDDRDVFTNVNEGDVIDGGGGGDDFDTLDLRGDDVDFITYTSADREDGIITFNGGGTATFEEIENVIPCFTPGTLIATPKGEMPVETLTAGDRVITRDNGIQVLRWAGARALTAAEMEANEAFCPVMIRQGALGHGLPERDMVVSPQHRVLIANDEAMLYFDEREVLVAAKHLVGRPGVERMGAQDATYIHVMFDNHEVILSDGAWTESFQPGDQTLNGLGKAQREEIFAIFPELADQEGREAYTAARRKLKRREAELLVK